MTMDLPNHELAAMGREEAKHRRRANEAKSDHCEAFNLGIPRYVLRHQTATFRYNKVLMAVHGCPETGRSVR